MMIPRLDAITTGEKVGLYQRLAYGVPLTWLLVFALVLIRDSRPRWFRYVSVRSGIKRSKGIKVMHHNKARP
jgi:hypothetical protein